jgi:hypothetical protein
MINDFYFENEHHGWAVGQDIDERGILLETFDGGISWKVEVDSLSARLNSLHFADGFGWAVGENGLILRTEYISTTGVEEDIPSGDMKHSQLENYPNPFRSSTRIRYQLPVTGRIKLGIYDLGGRKVNTLVNEKQSTGWHEVEWNTEAMQPGIYLCRLSTSRGRKVIKMI